MSEKENAQRKRGELEIRIGRDGNELHAVVERSHRKEKKTELKAAERDMTVTFKGMVEQRRIVNNFAEYDGWIKQGTYFDRSKLNFRFSLSGLSGLYRDGTIEINVDIGAGVSNERSESGRGPNVLHFTYKPKRGAELIRTIKIEDDLNDKLYKRLETLASHTQEEDAESANIAAKDALMETVKAIKNSGEGITVRMICNDVLQALELG